MKKTVLASASAMLVLATAGQLLSQGVETLQDAEPPLPILIQEDLYILELGIGIALEVRCLEPSGRITEVQGVEDSPEAERDASDTEPAEGALLGPCGVVDGQTKVHRLLERLRVEADLAAEIKALMEEELRGRIQDKVREHINQRIRENKSNTNMGGI